MALRAAKRLVLPPPPPQQLQVPTKRSGWQTLQLELLVPRLKGRLQVHLHCLPRRQMGNAPASCMPRDWHSRKEKATTVRQTQRPRVLQVLHCHSQRHSPLTAVALGEHQ